MVLEERIQFILTWVPMISKKEIKETVLLQSQCFPLELVITKVMGGNLVFGSLYHTEDFPFLSSYKNKSMCRCSMFFICVPWLK